MIQLTPPIERIRLMEPTTLEGTGLSTDLVADLVLKTLHRVPELSGTTNLHREERVVRSKAARVHCEFS